MSRALALVPDIPAGERERCARFFRVSSDGQDERNQFGEVDKHCETREYDVVKTFRLHDVSASKGEQEPALDEILADIRAGKYTVVVVAHSSRLDRRDPDVPMLFQIMVRKAGGRVESVREPEFGRGTLAGRVLALLSHESNYEYARALRDNVQASVVTVRKNGALWGKPPWGYTSEGERRMRKLIPTAQGREIVPQIFALVTEGKSLKTIALWLESEGVQPTGIKKEPGEKSKVRADGKPYGKSGEWHHASIAKIIRNTTYRGVRLDGNGNVATRCEPLVNANVWAAANAVLDAGKKRGGPIPRRGRCYLSGAARCYQCGGPLYRVHPNDHIAYLRCYGTGAHRKNCGAPMIPLSVAEALTEEVMGGMRSKVFKIERVYGNKMEKKLEKELLQAGWEQFTKSGASFEAQEAELKRVRRASEEIDARPDTPDKWAEVETDENYGDKWRAMSVDEKADWLRSYIVICFIKGEERNQNADAYADGVSLIYTWINQRDLPD